MPETITPLESANLAEVRGVRHGFFTRTGGVSGGIYASLNGGVGSDDDQAAVAENRTRMARHMSVAPDRFLTPYQIHSADVQIVDGPWNTGVARPRVDALVTATPGLAIAVNTADCAPVLFIDPGAGVIGAAHAGWKGAVGGVVANTITAMESRGAARESIRAAVGPCISGANYEVGDDFRTDFLQRDPASTPFFHLPTPESRPHFDLQGYLVNQLKRLGIADAHGLSVCTYGNADRFFSYRRSTHLKEPDYGRQISAIALI